MLPNSLRQFRLRLIFLLLAPLALARRFRRRRTGWIDAPRRVDRPR